jgi:predicted CXXCH cytochrome family protein
VTDLDSLNGVRVNGKRISRTVLSAGDQVQLGDMGFRVELADAVVSLVQRLGGESSTSREKTEVGAAEAIRKLRIDSYLPPMRVLSYAALILVVGIFFVRPMFTRHSLSWSSGPISNSHKLIAADCTRCHSMPFTHVPDKECQSCHSMSEHTKDMAQLTSHHPDMTFRCGQCHMEHNGDGALISRDSRFCVQCHSSIGAFKQNPSIENVASFEDHPQFRVAVSEPSGRSIRVPIDDQARAKDSTPIKLNHAVHLKRGLRGKNGPVTLECSSCHELDRDFRVMKPIRYEQHCADCHTLGFDERLPNAQVPHGDAEGVYAALFTEYTKLFLLKEGPMSIQLPKDREMPKGTKGTSVTPPVLDTTAIAASARDAERQLFTKTACFECHNVTEKPASEQNDSNSHYRVPPPHIPNVWYSAARFSHGAHEPFACESCHQGTRKSTKTSDLLLPDISNCRECHVQQNKPGFVTSDCVLCHSYHVSESVPHGDKKDITEYLSGLTR